MVSEIRIHRVPHSGKSGCLLACWIVAGLVVVWLILNVLGITKLKFEVTNNSGEHLRNVVLLADPGGFGRSYYVLGRQNDLPPGESFRVPFDIDPGFALKVTFDGPHRPHSFEYVRWVDRDEPGPWSVDIGEGFSINGSLLTDHGEDYAYKPDTLRRFWKLLGKSPEWLATKPPRNPQGMLTVKHHRTGLVFVLIPAGSFLMGSPEEEGHRMEDEGPVHRVKVPAFMICQTECTQSAWEKWGGKNDSGFKGADRPVERVSWTECHEWCAMSPLRLSSEAEWEYACRAGTATPFSTGATITTDQANYDGNYPYGGGPRGEYREETVAVGSLPANPWGLFEMHGNVWEWCEDAWHEDYEGAPTDGTAWTSGGAPSRVGRGGGWLSYALNCRSAFRGWWLPSFRFDYLGFRPAADIPALEKPEDD